MACDKEQELVANLKAEHAEAQQGCNEGIHSECNRARVLLQQLAQAQAQGEARCKRVIVHFKSLLAIDDAIAGFIDRQFIAMQALFTAGGLTIERSTTEDLSEDQNLEPLKNLTVGQCLRGQPTREQTALFENRNGVGDNELVVYIVSTLIGNAASGNFLGCAASPVGRPGAVVVQSETADWLVAHEVGHALGLSHVCEMSATPGAVVCVSGSNESDSLMFPNVGWTNVPPDLSASEYTTMITSRFNFF